MSNPPEEGQERLQRAIAQRLENLHHFGVRQLLPGRKLSVIAPQPLSEVVEQPPKIARGVPAATPQSQPIGNLDTMASKKQQAALSVLQQEVAACRLCPELASTRTQTVFGVGNPQARLCFFGEAPGADEDRTGEPFVGRAGKLLTKIIEACTLSRADVYILNVLKCRPPENRNPSTEEAASCRGFFERQLEIIKPEYICCLGTVAARNLLQTTQSIGKLRGEFHDWNGIKVLATYHPAYLLRNPPAKRHVWDDMKILMQAMGLEIPDTYA